MATMQELVEMFQEDRPADERLVLHKVVCPRCDGEGRHTNPAIDGNGITQSDREDWADDDFMEDYMAGHYDVRCEECEGRNVVDAVDALRTPHEVIVDWEGFLASYHESEMIYAMERRMGA